MPLILIVDDNPVIRRVMHAILDKEFNVIEACCGKDALNIVALRKPDVVIMDVSMPGGIDGMEVLDSIKADPALKATRVIMVTGKEFFEVSTCLARGADDFFTKPFRPAELMRSVKLSLDTCANPN